jgi:hypothetical protein
MTSRCNLEGRFIPKGNSGLDEFERNHIIDELGRLPWFDLHEALSSREHEKAILEPPEKPTHPQCRMTRDNFFLRDSHSLHFSLKP